MTTRATIMPDLYQPHGEVGTRVWLLLPLRLYVGAHFFLAGIGKVGKEMLTKPDETLGAMLRQSVDAADYPYGFYRAFYHGVIDLNISLFAFLVVFGELFVGLAIATGTLTRWACVAGIFMMLNFSLAFNKPLAVPDNTTSFAVIMLVLLLTNAGRAYGVDHFLRGKVAPWIA
jgi:thiosulfate dehydrogenase [quinone] large subunit